MAIAIKKKDIESAMTTGLLISANDIKQEGLLEVARDVMRARTLSILRRFEKDSERKSSVIRFLIEADIISKLKIDLSDADLSGVSLRFANLSNTTLSFADLSNITLSFANLSNTTLSFADMSFAKLSDADLSNADLSNADMSGADLSNADMSFANLFDANLFRAKGLTVEQLEKAIFCRTTLPKGLDIDPNRNC